MLKLVNILNKRVILNVCGDWRGWRDLPLWAVGFMTWGVWGM